MGLRPLHAIGHVGVDILVDRHGNERSVPGGSLLHFAAGYTVLDPRLALHSVVDWSNREVSWALEVLRHRGVDVSFVAGGPLTYFRLEYPRAGDSAVIADISTPSDVDFLRAVMPLPRSGRVHFSTLSPVTLHALLMQAQATGLRVSVQTHASLVSAVASSLVEFAPVIRRLFLNAEEAELLRRNTGRSIGELAALMGGDALVVLTHSDGADFRSPTQSVADYRSTAMKTAIEPTGAGDVFSGAFVAAENLGLEPQLAVRFAAAVAAICVLEPSSAGVLSLLARMRPVAFDQD